MAAAEENVVITAGDCSVRLMPALGGKIASIRVGDEELLQTPLHPYAPRTHTTDFAESDASGWDECLPSVAGCTVDTEAGQAAIPDHGDLWRISWQVLQAGEDSAILRVKCFSLPLQLTRSILLTESATGWRLELLYSLTNLGAYRVPWSWCAHMLLAVDAGDRIVLPQEVSTLRLESSKDERLGVTGDSVAWPMARTREGVEVDLSLVRGSELRVGDKLFAGSFGMGTGWCALERDRIGLRLTVRFEPSFTPYLGLWICYGGWPEGDGARQFCAAPEPATAPVDSLAEMGEWSRWLEPGETTNWPLELEIERMSAQNPGEKMGFKG